MKLFAGERLDQLLAGGYQIIQHEEEFAFSIDAVLLAYFAKVKRNCQAIDLGTGTGVIALLLAARGAKLITGLEVNSRMVGLAQRSVVLNHLSERIRIIEADYRYPKIYLIFYQPGRQIWLWPIRRIAWWELVCKMPGRRLRQPVMSARRLSWM